MFCKSVMVQKVTFKGTIPNEEKGTVLYFVLTVFSKNKQILINS